MIEAGGGGMAAGMLAFGPRTRGAIVNAVTSEKLMFQFNPAEISDAKDTSYEEVVVPGLSHPMLQFTAGGARKISFALQFSAAGYKRDVLSDIRWLQSLQYPQWGAGALKSAPPRVVLVIGKVLNLRGVVRSADVTYKRLDASMRRVLDASVNVVIEEYAPKSVDMWQTKKGEVDSDVAGLIRRLSL